MNKTRHLSDRSSTLRMSNIFQVQFLLSTSNCYFPGLVLWWLPRYDAEHTHFIRCAMLLSTALAFLFGSRAIGCQSGGVFAIAVLTIIAVYRWKLDNRYKVRADYGQSFAPFQNSLLTLVICDFQSIVSLPEIKCDMISFNLLFYANIHYANIYAYYFMQIYLFILD